MNDTSKLSIPTGDLGAADELREGAFRRGYHQAIAEVAEYLRREPGLTAGDLDAWVEGKGMEWRKDMPLGRMIEPPQLT